MGTKSFSIAPPLSALGSAADTRGWCTSLSILLIDVVALTFVYWLIVVGRHLITPGSYKLYIELFPVSSLFVLAFAIQGLYPGSLIHPAEEIRRVFHGISAVFLLVLCATFLSRGSELYSRGIILMFWGLGAPSVILARRLGRNLLCGCSWWGVPAVVLGSGPAAQRVVHALKDRKLGIRVRWTTGDELPDASLSGAKYAILVTAGLSKDQLHQIVEEQCHGYPHVVLVPDFLGMCSLGTCVRELGGEVGFEISQQLFHANARIIKRTLDLALSVPALVILSPLLILLAAVIRISSSGPAFFGHIRLGRNGRDFTALKFRTMFQNGDAILEQHFKEHPEDLIDWQSDRKLRKDPRVTPIGKWLRRLSLDELPQLWNVAMGEMSLVGPRPIVEAEIPKYGGGYELYTRVCPGITGLWQVSGRNNTTYQERVTLDEYYVRNWSVWLDLYILIRTFRTVLSADGAY